MRLALRNGLVCTVLILSLHGVQADDTNDAPQSPAATSQSIGMEGPLTLVLPGPDFRPRPLDDRTELILRLDNITKLTNNWHRYQFYYIGLEPGVYKLAEFIVHADGRRADELADASIEARAVLPETHNGQLAAYQPRRFPFFGGYRAFLIAIGVIWVGGLAGFIFAGRRKVALIEIIPPVPEPTFAERLRPLVERAARGNLDAADQAILERLLIGFWRDKLALSGLRMADALARLKAHEEAGALLRLVESWLHRPHGATQQQVTAALEPYGQPPTPSPTLNGA